MPNEQTLGELWAAMRYEMEQEGLDQSAARFILEEVYGTCSFSTILTKMSETVQPAEKERAERWMRRYVGGEPLQYIFNEAHFYGYPLYVDEAVLIPRPETEELVHYVLEHVRPHYPNGARMADIGTGSGAIAIALQKEWPEASVVATDISEEALAVARRNDETYKTSIDFRRGDLLEPLAHETYDIIVSNPPYIAVDEKGEMTQSTIDYEPDLALYSEEDGYSHYRQLFEHVARVVAPDGWVIVEIGHRQAERVRALAEQHVAPCSVEVVQDMSGKDRIVVVRRTVEEDQS